MVTHKTWVYKVYPKDQPSGFEAVTAAPSGSGGHMRALPRLKLQVRLTALEGGNGFGDGWKLLLCVTIFA